ncbi:MAG TPA: RHS repeat-associated core domain-containing protein [Terriglobales bacterium]|nr:RHS repeat-associated core domain-containing protein [Terriglobales bacterium]
MTAPGDPCSGLSWTYDAWGNRTDQTGGGGNCYTFHAAADTNNRLVGYSYDGAGNMIGDGTHTYTYDAENRIIAVDGGAATYKYDALGRRTSKTVGSAGTDYLYDLGGQVATEYNNGCTGGQWCWSAGYIALNGQLLAEYKDATTYFVLADHLGSTRLLTKVDRTIQDSLDYQPYGEQTSGDTGTTHKFTGKERDSESGLDYSGARYLGSAIGRFLSPDPDNFGAANDAPQSWTAYSYAANNPLNAIDPSGLDCIYTSDQSSGSVTVTVKTGDCYSDTDNGVYVNGTVDVNSLSYNGRTGELGYNFSNPDEGTGGTGVIALAAPPTDQLNWYARAVFSQRSLQVTAATMTDWRTYALWYLSAAAVGTGGRGLASLWQLATLQASPPAATAIFRVGALLARGDVAAAVAYLTKLGSTPEGQALLREMEMRVSFAISECGPEIGGPQDFNQLLQLQQFIGSFITGPGR